MSLYAKTVSSFKCNEWKNQCTANAAGDLQLQKTCDAQTCGSEEATLLNEGSSPSASSGVSSAAGSATRSLISQTSSTSQTSETTSTSQSGNQSPTVSGTDSRTTPANAQTSPPNNTGSDKDTQTGPRKAKLSPGAIAGIVVGVVLGVVAIAALCLCCKRAQKKAQDRETYYDEKGAPIPTVTEIPNKPELDAQYNTIEELPSNPRPSELPGLRADQTTELPSPPYQAPSELYSAQNYQHQHPSELQTPQNYQFHNASELHAAPVPYNPPATYSPPTELDRETTSSPNAAGPVLAYQDEPPLKPKAQDLYSSPVLTERSIQGLSAEEIATLQEEERRIDAEMEEVKRMRELREQKLAIQQKLLNARGGS